MTTAPHVALGRPADEISRRRDESESSSLRCSKLPPAIASRQRILRPRSRKPKSIRERRFHRENFQQKNRTRKESRRRCWRAAAAKCRWRSHYWDQSDFHPVGLTTVEDR